jgi:hypothetical protein
MRYGRVVIKLNGAALSVSEPIGLDAAALKHVADQVLAVAGRSDGSALDIPSHRIFVRARAQDSSRQCRDCLHAPSPRLCRLREGPM